jgi:hypothetical protein
MKHKVFGVGFLVFLLAVIFGCGGGGGGGSAGPTTTTTTGTVTMTISPSKITLPPSGSTTFTASVSDGTGVTFTKSGGTLAVTGLTAKYTAPTVLGPYTVTATSTAHAGLSATADVTVSNSVVAGEATLSGTVADENGGLTGITIIFYSSGGTQLATATTTTNGAFTVTLPTSAKSFNLEASTINTVNDYSQFEFGTTWYSPTISGCNAPVPALTNGETLTLGAITLSSTANPPPPPPNCG